MQETCHLLLQLPMYHASRDFVILSLVGSREVDNKLDEGKVVTIDSYLDHYSARPATADFQDLTFWNSTGFQRVRRKKEVIVIVRPYCSPNPEGPKYEQYCKQKLMIHQPFYQVDELLGACDKHSSAYHQFLRCGKVPPSLADDIHRLELDERESHSTDIDEKVKKYLHSYPY